MPKFLTPQWVRYLREKHDDILLILLTDAADDYASWKERTKTQAGLEEWAEETREKLGYQY